MYTKLICVVLITVLLLESTQGKRTRKNKYVNNETQDSTPQPSVLTYSTFGFNDVGSYDGFLPSSPDYANYLNHNREPSTRLYAPAFPSAVDSNLGSNNGPQTEEQNNMNNFQPASTNFFTSPSADYKGQSAVVNEGVYGQNTDDALAYGAKLSSRPKTKFIDNNTGINIYGSISSITELEASNEKNSLGANTQSYPDTKITPSHSNNIQQNMFRHSFQSPYKENESFEKPTSTTSPSVLKFPKVIDFTKYKPNYPTSMENKYVDMTQKPFNIDALVSGDDNSNVNTYSQPISNQYQPKYDYKDTPSANEGVKYNTYHYQDTPDNSIHIGQGIKHNKDNGEYKDKVKSRPWNVNSEERKKYRNMKGYEYSTNQSSTSFKYDYGPPKSDFNNSADEIAPASSNHGFTSYQLPENQYSELGKTPSIKSPFSFENNKGLSFYQEKPVEELFYHEKPVEEPNYEYKTSYTTLPTISSNWGNIFKTSDYSVHKIHSWKPLASEVSDIVHIPKKHENQKYFKQFESNPNEWLFSSNFRPSKPNYKPQIDWNENLSNRYKSEEDLLGLRTHDTLQPNNLPNYKPSYNDFDEEIDYRKLVEKWRQNYIRSKQKDSLREYESYASDSKPVQVSRPYPIEVPNPVIVPVPQPYPVKVPIPKPVAVPVIRELTVPVEKPVLYPVVKKVPYPVEKPVPVPVVKQVRVPVMKPYPVAIPQIKPVFHHTKPHDDEPEDDDEYVPRPEKKPYNKKAKNHRSRPRPTPSRRPSRMTYQDRNKRRPPSRPTSSSSEHRYRRPTTRDHRPHRYHEDFEDYDHEASDYIRYCKRTGNC